MAMYQVEFFREVDYLDGDARFLKTTIEKFRGWADLMQYLSVLKRDQFVPTIYGKCKWDWVNIWEIKKDGKLELLRAGMGEF